MHSPSQRKQMIEDAVRLKRSRSFIQDESPASFYASPEAIPRSASVPEQTYGLPRPNILAFDPAPLIDDELAKMSKREREPDQEFDVSARHEMMNLEHGEDCKLVVSPSSSIYSYGRGGKQSPKRLF